MRWLALCLSTLWGQPLWAQGQFVETWSSVCTLGTDATAGCEDIRARKMLDASTGPWRAIGRVNFSSRDQRSHCTGTLISDRLVVTAAHCLYNAARKRWIPPASIRFVAGYQRGAAIAVSAAQNYILPKGQDATAGFNNQPHLDWAVLVLSEAIGAEVGFFSLLEESAQAGYVAGYPGLRPHVLSQTKTCAVNGFSKGLLRAICPVMMGDSGAPFMVETPEGPQIAGILSRISPTPDGIDALFVSVRELDGVQVP